MPNVPAAITTIKIPFSNDKCSILEGKYLGRQRLEVNVKLKVISFCGNTILWHQNYSLICHPHSRYLWWLTWATCYSCYFKAMVVIFIAVVSNLAYIKTNSTQNWCWLQ
jgi:hypothetical protein